MHFANTGKEKLFVDIVEVVDYVHIIKYDRNAPIVRVGVSVYISVRELSDLSRLTCDCGDNGICEHNHIRSTCQDCELTLVGGSVCEHNWVRFFCIDCDGNGFCEHGTRKYTCKDCVGSTICEHDRVRSYCKDCHGLRPSKRGGEYVIIIELDRCAVIAMAVQYVNPIKYELCVNYVMDYVRSEEVRSVNTIM